MKRCLRCDVAYQGGWTCPACGFAPVTLGPFPSFAPALADSGDDDLAHAYDRLDEVEPSHFWFVGRAALIVWAIRKYAGQVRSVLEVGCGTGGTTAAIRRAFPQARIVAGDAQVKGLDYARRNLPGAEVLQFDIRRLPFDREFQVVGAFDVIEHLDDDVAALRAMAQAVEPGGIVVVAVPQHRWLWSRMDEFSHHRRRYIRAELRAKVEGAGLDVLRMTSFMSLVLPLMLASRFKPGAFDPSAQLQVPRRVNAVCSGLSAIERALIEGGVSLPAGGSLLAVARRPS